MSTRTTPQHTPTPLDTAELLEKLQEIDENTEWDNLSGSAVFTPEEYGEIVHRVTVHAALVEALEKLIAWEDRRRERALSVGAQIARSADYDSARAALSAAKGKP